LRKATAVDGSHHLLSVSQFNRDAIDELFQLADVMQPIARRRKVSRVLEGAVLANLFFEASTRTRVSFGAAFCRLGGSVCDTTGFTFSSMAKGESIYDTSRVISGYVDAMVVRHPEQGSVAEFARATNVPVINGGDGPGEHPSQALLDLYTIQREFSRLGKLVDGAHIAMVGDLKYGRTVHSLIKLLALYKGMKFTLVSPPSLAMPAEIVEAVSRNGHVVETAATPARALAGADIIYAARRPSRFARPERRPQQRSAPGHLPPDRQRHSCAHGDLRHAAGRRQAREPFDARRRMDAALAHRPRRQRVPRRRLIRRNVLRRARGC
jgi:aspartate carbamoyltransferase catalytic subunit